MADDVAKRPVDGMFNTNFMFCLPVHNVNHQDFSRSGLGTGSEARSESIHPHERVGCCLQFTSNGQYKSLSCGVIVGHHDIVHPPSLLLFQSCTYNYSHRSSYFQDSKLTGSKTTSRTWPFPVPRFSLNFKSENGTKKWYKCQELVEIPFIFPTSINLMIWDNDLYLIFGFENLSWFRVEFCSQKSTKLSNHTWQSWQVRINRFFKTIFTNILF